MKSNGILNLIYQGKYSEAYHHIENLDISEKQEGIILQIKILLLKENYDKALSLSSDTLLKTEGINQTIFELGITTLQSYALYRLGKIEEASIAVETSKRLLRKLTETGTNNENLIWEAFLAEIEARLHWVNGKMNDALSMAKYALKLSEKTNDEFQKIMSLSLVGLMYRSQGLLTESIEYLKKSLLLAEGCSYIYAISYSLHVIGVTYFYKGDFNQAIHCFKRSLLIDEKEEKYDQISCSLFHLILTYLEMKAIKQAQDYLTKLIKLNEQANRANIYINLRTRLATALVLEKRPRLVQKAEAQQILKDLVNEDIISSDLTIYAMVHLCGLLLDELSLYGEQEVLKEAEELSSRLYSIAQDQHSYSLVVESLVLLSRFALIRGDISQANSLLEKAHTITINHDLIKFSEKVLEDQNALQDELAKSEEIIKNASMNERLEQARLNEYLTRIKDIVRSHG